MTTTPHHIRPRYLASAVAVAAPLLLFGAGTAPAYADPHDTPVPTPPALGSDAVPCHDMSIPGCVESVLEGPVNANLFPYIEQFPGFEVTYAPQVPDFVPIPGH